MPSLLVKKLLFGFVDGFLNEYLNVLKEPVASEPDNLDLEGRFFLILRLRLGLAFSFFLTLILAKICQPLISFVLIHVL